MIQLDSRQLASSSSSDFGFDALLCANDSLQKAKGGIVLYPLPFIPDEVRALDSQDKAGMSVRISNVNKY